ncbi:MAG: 23S rRNA (guanosine(2251)-2'-O)-methyltransferase RlmB [Candidatus Obscuribacterales bacterium]|nr:23S rRNA (guanosine(2251)-2'-O)-methyltransferase RlmB [Steroidobacteraceae bacterium]
MSDACWVFGWHAVRTLLTRHPARVMTLLVQKGREDERMSEVLRLASQHSLRPEQRAVRELDQLSGGINHQGIAAELRPSANLGEGALDQILDAAGAAPLVLILDGVQDPHNLGACLRSADGAGVHAVVVPRDRAAGMTATVRKVASGAAETVPLIQVVNLSRTLKWLKERGLWLVGADGDAPGTIFASNLQGPLGLVLGAEGTGMRRLTREHCDVLAAIPMVGVVESLNVSVAAGVMLFEAVRQRTTRPA